MQVAVQCDQVNEVSIGICCKTCSKQHTLGALFILLPYFGGQFVQMVGSKDFISGEALNEAKAKEQNVGKK